MAYAAVSLERSAAPSVESGGPALAAHGPPARAASGPAAGPAGGAPISFSAAARTHEPALRAVALRLCRSQSDAHDLVQDALERGLRGWHKLPPGSNVRAWLLSILRNRFIDACRRGTREKPDESSVPADALPAPEGPDPDPAWTKITPAQLRAAVQELPEEFRVVYQLHALEGRSYVEISARLRIPKATVGTRLIRARRKLRDLLLPHLASAEEQP